MSPPSWLKVLPLIIMSSHQLTRLPSIKPEIYLKKQLEAAISACRVNGIRPLVAESDSLASDAKAVRVGKTGANVRSFAKDSNKRTTEDNLFVSANICRIIKEFF
jgi:hypothetical protein